MTSVMFSWWMDLSIAVLTGSISVAVLVGCACAIAAMVKATIRYLTKG